jgi:hypothetical protein
MDLHPTGRYSTVVSLPIKAKATRLVQHSTTMASLAAAEANCFYGAMTSVADQTHIKKTSMALTAAGELGAPSGVTSAQHWRIAAGARALVCSPWLRHLNMESSRTYLAVPRLTYTV